MKYVLIILGAVVLFGIYLFNRFITLRNRAEEAWADIEVQLKRRYDLIPNLVNSVKGYAAHEASAFENVTRARAAAMGASGPTEAHAQADPSRLAKRAEAENMLTGALKSIFAIAEAYPDLKANQNFLALQRELSDTENKIQAARRFYNVNVRDLNTSIESFPGNLVAQIFKFPKKDFFDLADSDAAQGSVEVKF